MPAKKPAPKAAKGRSAATSKIARKPAPRKTASRVRPAPSARKSSAAARRKPAAPAAATPPKKPVAAARPSAPQPPETPTRSAPAAPEAAGAPTVPTKSVPTTRIAVQPLVESDESDSSEPGSLLAGPRNVTPYIAKRGEQYMSKEQLEHFRHILLNWKRDLMVEVDRTVSHMKDEAANFPDPNDRATQEEEFSLELRTRDRERKLIRKIDEALKRIEDGSYGYCLETGEEIGIKRLEARPVATLSIEAQERRERREKQYGDREDRYR